MFRYLLFLFIINLVPGQIKQFSKTLTLMYSPFEIIVVDSSEIKANKYIDYAINETQRIENLVSAWKSDSQISQINKNAGIKAIKVDKEVFNLIQRSLKISKITDGAFDISWAGMDKIWKFDGTMKTLPSEQEIKNSVKNVGYKNIILDEKNQTIFLKNKGMKLGLDGITQGYVADKLKKDLMDKGCKAGLVNVSGDISVWGKQENGKPWNIGIKNPLNKNNIFAWFDIEDRGVETSGTYEKFVELNGKKYSHIINPRTGYPAQGISSITIFAPTTEMADALATGLLVMGTDVALNFINQIKGLDCIIINDKGEVFYSQNIKNKEIKR